MYNNNFHGSINIDGRSFQPTELPKIISDLERILERLNNPNYKWKKPPYNQLGKNEFSICYEYQESSFSTKRPFTQLATEQFLCGQILVGSNAQTSQAGSLNVIERWEAAQDCTQDVTDFLVRCLQKLYEVKANNEAQYSSLNTY